ncbi:MAG TPA: hypothetical protein VH143_34540 [Kofleriaceae bacterium]|jgi:hypothetical protein|nr:hypothetical protein [Kofleriaceae bacterium]
MIRSCLLALAFTLGCSPPPTSPHMSPPATACSAAITAFASGDPSQLRPIPATCTLTDAAAVLHSLDTESRGVLADRKALMTIKWFSSAKLPKILAWLDATGHIVLLDAAYPPGAADAFIKSLGPPEHRLDYQWRNDTLPGAEMVWPSRGAVVVASPDVKGLIRVAVFAPTTIDDYKANLRFVDLQTDDNG